MQPARTVPYRPPPVAAEETLSRLRAERARMEARRTVRQFSRAPVPREAIEEALRVAGTAPSGAHLQPWYFVAISDPALKARLREAAEVEERAFYESRATPEWLEALAPLGTDLVKEHLTDAPWVIVVFRRDRVPVDRGPERDAVERKTYYAAESVGIAVGFLISALHRAGLATLTHTPAPMTFLRELCGRPPADKPFMMVVVGYPHPECEVPDLSRKALSEIAELR